MTDIRTSLSAVLDIGMYECKKCPALVQLRTQVVPSEWSMGINDGGVKPAIMLLLRNPGATEDANGRPAIGSAGKVLRDIISPLHGMANFYIANVVKCWTPKNREPEDIEIENCKPYLMAEMSSVKPDAVVLMGRTVERVMAPDGLERHGFRNVEGVVWGITYHPSFAARGNSDARVAIGRDIMAAIRVVSA